MLNRKPKRPRPPKAQRHPTPATSQLTEELTAHELEAICAAGGKGEPAAARHTVIRGGKYTIVK
jgi:hypothetical protein